MRRRLGALISTVGAACAAVLLIWFSLHQPSPATAAFPAANPAAAGVACADVFTLTPGAVVSLTAHFSGVVRGVTFYLPSSYSSSEPLPLVFGLHGGNQDRSVWLDDRHFIELAEAAHYIGVMPDGLPAPGAPPGTNNFLWNDEVNEDYIVYLLDCMIAQHAVDQSRVYLLGFSGGAKLSYRLSERGDTSGRFAGIGTMAGDWGGRMAFPTTTWEFNDPNRNGAVPLNAIILQGGQDVKEPTEGGFNEDRDGMNQPIWVKWDAWRFFISSTNSLSVSLSPLAPARVTATLHTNPGTGFRLLAVYDPLLAHKWPDWNYMAIIWTFFTNSPTRTVGVTGTAPPPPVVFAPGPPPPAPPVVALTAGVLQTFTLNYSGSLRDVVIYVPSTYTGAPVPLLMVLHGHGQEAANFYEPGKHITLSAELKNYIAVFPNALPPPGAPGGGALWVAERDIPYLNHVLDTVMANAAIDRRCVYVSGFSNGANMTLGLAADYATSRRIAAIATVAGEIGSKPTFAPGTPWNVADPTYNGALPTSALFLHGVLDPRQPLLGGLRDELDGIGLGARVRTDHWRMLIGQLAGDGVTVTVPFAPPHVGGRLYLNAATGYAVLDARDPVLGHSWPEYWSGPGYIATMWEFFEQVPKRAISSNLYLPLLRR